MPTSAIGLTPVITGGVTLLVEFGSLVGELTLAVLVSEPLAGKGVAKGKGVDFGGGRIIKKQITTPPFFTPLPPALTKVTVAGRLSVTTTLLATDGPKLVTEIV